jgi:hypothetical protein
MLFRVSAELLQKRLPRIREGVIISCRLIKGNTDGRTRQRSMLFWVFG